MSAPRVHPDDEDEGFADGRTVADPDAARRVVERERRTRTEEALKVVFRDLAPEVIEGDRGTGAQPVLIDNPLAPPQARGQGPRRSTQTAIRVVSSGSRLGSRGRMIVVGALVAIGALAGAAAFLLR